MLGWAYLRLVLCVLYSMMVFMGSDITRVIVSLCVCVCVCVCVSECIQCV